MLIYGMGDMHLSVLAAKLKTRFGVSVRLEEPKIPYREKITKPLRRGGQAQSRTAAPVSTGT